MRKRLTKVSTIFCANQNDQQSVNLPLDQENLTKFGREHENFHIPNQITLSGVEPQIKDILCLTLLGALGGFLFHLGSVF